MKPVSLDTIYNFNIVKSIALKALFSDDELMEMLVFKGGNALNLIYQIAARASLDLDFSIENTIKAQDTIRIKEKILFVLNSSFDENGYKVFDYNFYQKPKRASESHPNFWGGYRIEFKIVEKQLFNKHKDDLESLRRNAVEISSQHSRIFYIDISKYEYCQSKVSKDFDGFTIYVYSPEMIVCEKLRAICQQMPEYLKTIKNSERGASERARDFYDIYIIIEKLHIDMLKEGNLQLLNAIFDAKKVPVELLKRINIQKDFHLIGYDSLKDTIPSEQSLQTFDFYFNFIIQLAEDIINQLDNKFSK